MSEHHCSSAPTRYPIVPISMSLCVQAPIRSCEKCGHSEFPLTITPNTSVIRCWCYLFRQGFFTQTSFCMLPECFRYCLQGPTITKLPRACPVIVCCVHPHGSVIARAGGARVANRGRCHDSFSHHSETVAQNCHSCRDTVHERVWRR